MKQFFKIGAVCLSILLLLASSCSVAFAVDVTDDNVYSIDVDKPTVSDTSGYAEFLFENKQSGFRFVVVFCWAFAPTVDTSSDYYNYADVLKPDFTIGTQSFDYEFSSNQGIIGTLCGSFIDSTGQYQFFYRNLSDGVIATGSLDLGDGYALVGYHLYGTYNTLIVSNSYGYDFFVTYAADSVISHNLNQILANLISIENALGVDGTLVSKLDTIISSLNSFSGSFDEFKTYYSEQMVSLFSYLDDYLSKLETLIDQTDEIEPYLDNIAAYVIELHSLVFDLWIESISQTQELVSINAKLQQIIDILNMKSDTEFTTQDPTQFDDYYDVENSLLDNSNVNVDDVVKVEVNQNALTVIWEYVERALNSHGKVFGMVLTVLALGIIALILGR